MIETMKQALEALKDFGNHRHDCPQWPTYTEPEKYPACDCGYDKALKSIDQAIAEAEKQVAFKIYKPTPPRGAIPNVRDAELPWVYDQDPSSGNVASMWVTPVHPHPQPKREWVGLTDEEIEACYKQGGIGRAIQMLKEKNI